MASLCLPVMIFVLEIRVLDPLKHFKPITVKYHLQVKMHKVVCTKSVQSNVAAFAN